MVTLVAKTFNDLEVETGRKFSPDLVVAKMDEKQVHKVGDFSFEFIRVTHSLPDASAICINTPAGRIIATGDFRLDPEPLDKLPTDTARLRELGDSGLLLLMSDSSYSDCEGRVPTESTLQESFHDVIGNAPGRIFVAAFSSNMNRTQMIINAAVKAGRKVALDGRGMLSYSEIAVEQGILKIPKGTVIPIAQAGVIEPSQLLVMCTGGQGEANAALQRMSEGAHKFVNLDAGDTVVISSSPIPGNEVSYDALSNRLKSLGVLLFRHVTHELDGCGPLHVSGHAKRDELREMINLVRPLCFIPVHGGKLRRSYHADLAVQEGVARENSLVLDNGDSLLMSEDGYQLLDKVKTGSILIDQNGLEVAGTIVKDRLVLESDGFISVILTIDQNTGMLLSSPDIISRGFIALKESEEVLSILRSELKRAVQQRFKRVDPDRFKLELKDFVSGFCFEQTGRTPIVLPVVNVVGSRSQPPKQRPAIAEPVQDEATKDLRFAEMRARLLGSK
jgi:ribonuclease J